jgi:hypothetical protein
MERWHRERQEVDTPLEAEQELRRQVIALRQKFLSGMSGG